MIATRSTTTTAATAANTTTTTTIASNSNSESTISSMIYRQPFQHEQHGDTGWAASAASVNISSSVKKVETTTTVAATTTNTAAEKLEMEPEMMMKETQLNDILDNKLDYTRGGICGMYKCFFHSTKDKEDEGEAGDVGYLISVPKGNIGGPMSLQKLQQAYQLAQSLDDEVYSKSYDNYFSRNDNNNTTTNQHLNRSRRSHHLLRSPVYQLNSLKKERATKLNSNLLRLNQRNMQCYHLKFENPNVIEKHNMELKTRYQSSMPIFIQKVQAAPNPHFIVGCQNDNDAYKVFNYSTNCLIDFFQQQQQRRKESDDVNQVLRNFEHNLRYIQDHVITTSNPQYHCLYFDFQILLDASTGNIYHIDIDRCYQKLAKQYMKSLESKHTSVMQGVDQCFNSIYTMIDTVRKNLLGSRYTK